jgi:hypothetical protein
MPDETVTYDGKSHKMSFTDVELEFLYTLLDNVSVKGVGAVITLNGIVEKILDKYTPVIPSEPEVED